LDNDCYITEEKHFPVESIDQPFTQIYIMPLLTDLTIKSRCSIAINQTTYINKGKINHIYFLRKSSKATIIFQQLDLMKENLNIEQNIQTINSITKRFLSYFNFIKWIIIYSEDLIQSDLNACEKKLTDFISLLGLKVSKEIIQYDSHNFIEDATWWDQSDVAESLLNPSQPSPPTDFTYSNDFYHLHGNKPFSHYLSANRQCYNQGIFPQLPSETIANHTTDNPDRCLTKPYDCAFSDIYSFNDREKLYQKTDYKTIKCGFTIHTPFDIIKNRYGRNHTCETIVFTLITNCYDPLPIVQDGIKPSFCFIALLDTKTINGHKELYAKNSFGVSKWDIIDLGTTASPFSLAAKSIETLKTLGTRLFPLAKWIVWLDGKANVVNLYEILKQARAPFMSSPHDVENRTVASEIIPTIDRLRRREKILTDQFNRTLRDIEQFNRTIRDILIQEQEYIREGYYSRSDELGLRMFDIAVTVYRNHHPCMFKYLCGWHNELNYFSHRGQLSVFYPAVRLNLTDYLHFIPRKHFFIFDHKSVC
jgi:hypothetical protein